MSRSSEERKYPTREKTTGSHLSHRTSLDSLKYAAWILEAVVLIAFT